MKKTMAMLLALLLVAVMLPVTAMAADSGSKTVVSTLEELENAVGNLHNGDYIAFGANIVQDKVDTTSGQITFARASDATGDIEATLDLSGHVFDGQIGGYSFKNKGITVNVYGTEKTVAEYYQHETGHHMVKASAVFNYSGKTVLKSGLFESNNIVIMGYGGEVVVEDGIIHNTADGLCLYAVNDALVTVNGGEFSFEGDGALTYIQSGQDKPQIVINDGEFDASKGNAFCFKKYPGEGYDNCQVTINGGDFTFKSADDIVGYENEADKDWAESRLVINGGTFNINPAKYVAAGCPVTKNADGKYVVGANNDNHDDTAVANTEVSISKESMTSTTGTTLQVNETTSVTFDNAAMGTISSQAGNADYVTLEVKVGVEAPQDVQTAYEMATKDTNANCVFTVDLVGIKNGEQKNLFTAADDGTNIGTATVRFQYEKNAKDVKCYYLSGGNMVEINGDNFTYDSSTGMVTVKLNHFSTYVVTGNTSTGAGSITIIVPDDTTDTTTTTETTKNPTTGMNDFVSAAIAVAAVSLLGMAAVLRKK